MRKRIIKSVLATDMAKHGEDLDLFWLKLSDPKFHTKKMEENDKLFLMGMAVHCADISNPTKNWLV